MKIKIYKLYCFANNDIYLLFQERKWWLLKKAKGTNLLFKIKIQYSVSFIHDLKKIKMQECYLFIFLIHRLTKKESVKSTFCFPKVGKHLTKYFNVLKLNPFVFSKWSTSLPGDAENDSNINTVSRFCCNTNNNFIGTPNLAIMYNKSRTKVLQKNISYLE